MKCMLLVSRRPIKTATENLDSFLVGDLVWNVFIKLGPGLTQFLMG